MDLEGIRKWEWCVGMSDRMEVVGVERVVCGYGPSMLEMVNTVGCQKFLPRSEFSPKHPNFTVNYLNNHIFKWPQINTISVPTCRDTTYKSVSNLNNNYLSERGIK
jgi:hypothetical protein